MIKRIQVLLDKINVTGNRAIEVETRKYSMYIYLEVDKRHSFSVKHLEFYSN